MLANFTTDIIIKYKGQSPCKNILEVRGMYHV